MKNRIRLISWNVNGLRSVIKQGLLHFIEEEDPDILCLQETKIDPAALELNLPAYHAYWNFSKRKGYSGTAILTKIKPLSAKLGMEMPQHDEEGRVVTLEFKDFYLVNVYTPNSKRDLSRLASRQIWDKDFLAYLKKLEKKKPVIFCGDLNVAHQEADLTNPKSNVRNHGFTPEERASFDRIVKSGFADTFREFVKEGGHYSWWSRFRDCRRRNIGLRIDYFLVSKPLRPRLESASILHQVRGSDHCPVEIVLK